MVSCLCLRFLSIYTFALFSGVPPLSCRFLTPKFHPWAYPLFCPLPPFSHAQHPVSSYSGYDFLLFYSQMCLPDCPMLLTLPTGPASVPSPRIHQWLPVFTQTIPLSHLNNCLSMSYIHTAKSLFHFRHDFQNLSPGSQST